MWNKPEASNDNSNIKSNSNSNIDASSNTNFCGKATYEFSFINDVPVEFHASSTQAHPGEVLTIFAKYANENDNITLNSELLQSKLPFYSYKQGKFAILPLGYTLTPSDYIINLQVEETNSVAVDIISSRKSTYDMTISVLPKDFPIQHLSISSQVQQSTQSDAAYEEYDKYVGSVRNTNTPVKMWDGVFLQPVEGRITTEFGMRRFVNNAPTSYRHSGIDIAADKGVPVKATNSGKVVLSKHLMLTGNTVLIDHGYGIISWSYHMDTLAVKRLA